MKFLFKYVERKHAFLYFKLVWTHRLKAQRLFFRMSCKNVQRLSFTIQSKGTVIGKIAKMLARLDNSENHKGGISNVKFSYNTF